METTLTLRNRLGFNEVSLWKQFCARRLHLIHTLSLNLRKASEQEEQVRVLAAELCAEYGFGPYAQVDFEKLLIAGIQSVRRNQKRSTRHPNGYNETQEVGAKQSHNGEIQNSQHEQINHNHSAEKPSSGPNGAAPLLTPVSLHANTHGSQYFDPGPPLADNSHPMHLKQVVSPPTNNTVARDPYNQTTSQNGTHNRTPGGPLATPMFQSLVVRLDVLRDMIGAASATWIESSAPVVAHMSAYGVLSTAVAAASVHGKLTQAESTAMRESILEGPLLESLRLALDPTLTSTRLLERIGALAASLVHGPHLLSALQALCVSLAQASHGSENDMRFMLKHLARSPGNSNMQPEGSSYNQRSEPNLNVSQSQPLMHSLHSHSVGKQVLPQHMTAVATPEGVQSQHVSQFVVPGTTDCQPVAATNNILSSKSLVPSSPHELPMKSSSDLSKVGEDSSNDSSPTLKSVPTSLVSSNNSDSSAGLNSATMGFHVGGPDRLVTLQYNNKTLKLTYSPMKATPPTISEIIDNARQSFVIPVSAVVRVKDVQRNKIIETNSELIDAFTQQQVKLEILIPPPMLMAMEPRRHYSSANETKFTHLAPILRKSV